MKKIISISVKGSDFYQDDFSVSFSEKLNCIMGGRGTGKSTLLYFLKSAFREDSESDKTLYSILKSNLNEGRISVVIEGEQGRTYEIQKSFGEIPLPYESNTDSHEPIEQIENDIECDFYEAYAIEEIGRNSYSRLELIDKMHRDVISDKLESIEHIKAKLNANAQHLLSHKRKYSMEYEKLSEFGDVEKELEKHKEEQPKDLDEKENEKFEHADKQEKDRVNERLFAEQLITRANDILRDETENAQALETFISTTSVAREFPNKNLIQQMISELATHLTPMLASKKSALANLESALKKLQKTKDELLTAQTEQQSQFADLKKRIEKHKAYYSKYNQLSKRINDKQISKNELDGIQKKVLLLVKEREAFLNEFKEVKKDIYEARKHTVEELNGMFDGKIKVTLTFGGIIDEFEDNLRLALRGSNMRYNILIPKIVQNFTPQRFTQIINKRDSESLKTVAGIDIERSESLFNALADTDEIFELETIYCPDLPDFLYKIDRKDSPEDIDQDNYRKSEDLSTGQRCTTVLPIVFAVSKNPLIIDQPEDNLDNKYITDTIRKIILEQKAKRQLIFITHNPNIPVLPDSEHNIFLNYKDKRSYVDDRGSIEEVKQSILQLLEGGYEAFEFRKELYG